MTVLAYGQTGSGKTYTIMGRDDAINERLLNNDQHTGLIPKTVKYIWNMFSGKSENIFAKSVLL